jgi:hypothetical protein
MNAALPRLLKSAYRREPIVSVLITMGIIDAIIGGFDDSWSLFAFGLGMASVTAAWRWWRVQQNSPLPQEEMAQPQPQLYLPSRSSSSALPMLSVNKKKPPQ